MLALSCIRKVSANLTAVASIERFDARRIVLASVAGGLCPGVRVGDIVMAVRFGPHDLDVSPLFFHDEMLVSGLSCFTANNFLQQQASGDQVVMDDPLACDALCPDAGGSLLK